MEPRASCFIGESHPHPWFLLFCFGFWFLGENAHFLPLHFCSLLTPQALLEAKEIYSLDSMEHALTLEQLQQIGCCEASEGYSDILFKPANLASMINAHSNREITLIAHNDIKLKAFDISTQGLHIKYSDAVVNIITPNELILSLNTFTPKIKHKKPTLKLNEIAQGEYVVHSEYGIGIFEGIKQTQKSLYHIHYAQHSEYGIGIFESA